MRRVIGLLTASALLLLVLVVPATADQKAVTASGTFTSTLDFSTLTLTPVGRACRLTVEGQLDFDGTLEGIADAATTALVFAPCEEVAQEPPGTFADVFASDLRFEGIVSEGSMSTPATADIGWFGRSRPGGQIESVMAVDGDDVVGGLGVRATVGVGGTYEGWLKLP
jgi:hypothetical protein